MEDRTDGPSFIFNCNCWIGKDKDSLQKYLLPEKNGKLMNKFSFDYCIFTNRSKLDKVNNTDCFRYKGSKAIWIAEAMQLYRFKCSGPKNDLRNVVQSITLSAVTTPLPEPIAFEACGCEITHFVTDKSRSYRSKNKSQGVAPFYRLYRYVRS